MHVFLRNKGLKNGWKYKKHILSIPVKIIHAFLYFFKQKTLKRNHIFLLLSVLFISSVWSSASATISKGNPSFNSFVQVADSLKIDTIRIDTAIVLPYPFKDQPEFVYPEKNDSINSIYLNRPSNIRTEIKYDPVSREYVLYEKIGNLNYRLPQSMKMDDYLKFDIEQSIKDYWREKRHIQDMDQRGSSIPGLTIGGEAFNRIFGGNNVNIKAQGYVEVSFGYLITENDNPSISESLRKVSTFDFDQAIQANVTGSIGEKVKMKVNYNTETSFDFENQMNLDYAGEEDEIIKKVEAGNVSLPLNGSLITGASNLFGVKAEMQFGKLNVTTLFSQNKGETTTVELEGGAQKRSFEIDVSDYDANRHFFLSQYFRDHYDEALKNLPVINSAITINKIEVWVTNKTGNYTSSRNILALMDLGEHEENIYNTISGFQETSGLTYPESVYPFNNANGLYSEMINNYSGIRTVSTITKTLSPLSDQNFIGGQDFEKIEQARLLSSSEYTINEQLGYISLNSALTTDEVLAVAYNYTANGETYQVGEFSSDGVDDPQTLVVKMLKGSNLAPGVPTWDLMMKNIYNLNAYDVTDDDFTLNILYLDDSKGSYINYFPTGSIAGHKFLTLMNLDNLNSQLDNKKDGAFDYIEDITVNPSSGRIIFPVVEPFGSHLSDSINNESIAKKYVFQALYDSTQTMAEQDADHDKYVLKGYYKGSSSNEISVGSINLSQGSVTVTAGGIELIENIDYTVNYTSGIIKILNQSLIDSGTTLTISTETEELYSVNQKTLLGTHANYAFSNKFNLGGTLLHMQERPLTSKVNYGEDPISNTMLGLDANYVTESNFLTSVLDKLPFYNSKETSSISIEGEYAQLLPGHSKVVGSSGTSYIDDFESTKTAIDMRSVSEWELASTPQGQTDLFPEGDLYDDKSYGYNRAKLAWYNIDPTLVRGSSSAPENLRGSDAKEQLSNHYVREVYEEEIFPDKESATGESTKIATFDLAYYPEEKGPYNYDTQASSYSSGVNPDGTLINPETRWGGIMREISASNFESANIAYIEFWMMDPFIYDTLGTDEGGDLYLNLGEISEDILKDGLKSYENGLPATSTVSKVDTTLWGRVSTSQSTVYEFDSGDEARRYQDLGLDGLNDSDEQSFYNKYMETLSGILNDDAYQEAKEDPSSDDFHYFKGSDYDEEELSVLKRYKKYNGPEGNSTPGNESYSTVASSKPDVEDINEDNTMNEYERYYQYKVSLRPDSMILGRNHIVDIKEGEKVRLKNGTIDQVKWYQFRIPIKSPDKTIGAISNYKSIRFMRLFMRDFEAPTFLRFATLDLVRSGWRKYTGTIQDDSDEIFTADTQFEISAVNIEENGSREPVNYILPPEIERTIDPSNTQLIQLNEQALDIEVIDLEAGDSRAAYSSLSMDFRNYKRLKMDVHAEEFEGYSLEDGDLSLFLRFGSDYNTNYYEYEVPLSLTPAGSYNSNKTADRYTVWPDKNRINVLLSAFTDTKKARNAAIKENSELTKADIYKVAYDDWMDGQDTIRIKGNPSLSNVEVMMIGIRHKKKPYDPGVKSVEVWANELRLSGYNEEGGWAANVRASMRLADLGTLNVAVSKSTAGFGSIDSKVDERSMKNVTQVDISSNLELGKFFPEKSGVKIPVYLGYSKNTSDPKYNPLDDDITMKESLRLLTKKEKDSLKYIAREVDEQKTISFSNVKIDKTIKKGKTNPIDPTNFSASYTYSKSYQRDVDTEYNIERNFKGTLNYNYSASPKPIEPFKKSKLFSKNIFRFIRDFNFYPYPSQITWWIHLDRDYNEIQLRDLTNTDLIIDPTYDKEFTLDRYFSMIYNLTRSLKLNFSTETVSIIDEPEGRMNKNDDDYTAKKDSILENLLKLGRPTDYAHTLNGTYSVPINKIPFLNWTSANATYTGTYRWTAGSITDESIELGNEIENNRVIQLNGQLNFVNLYNKVRFLKKVNKKYGQSSRQRFQTSRRQNKDTSRQTTSNKKPDDEKKEVQFSIRDVNLAANIPKRILHKLNTEEVNIKATNRKGEEIKGQVHVINKNTISFKAPDDIKGVKFIIKGKVEKTETPLLKIAQITSRLLMGVRNASISYSTNEGTYLPGFLPEPKVFGFGSGRYTPDPNVFGSNIKSSFAPGLPFLLGWQDDDFALKAIKNGWITKDTTLNSAYTMKRTETYNFRTTIEPIPDLKITLNAARTHTKRMSEYYLYNPEYDQFNASSQTYSGNFSMTINSIKTAFFKMRGDGVPKSEAYSDFRRYRQIIGRRLAAQRVYNVSENYDPTSLNEEGDADGYGVSSQLVMIPAFLAAYTGQNPEKCSLSPFPSLKYLRPNWQISYEGLVSKIGGLNKVMKSMSIGHQYRSTYTVGSYSSNLDYDELVYGDGFSYVRNTAGNFLGLYDFSSVNITEQFNPLIDLDIIWLNDFETQMEISRTRNITLSLTNNRITETLQSELAFGLGYRFTNMNLIIKTKKSQKAYSNDLNIKANLAFSRNKTILRQIDEGENELSAGQNTVTLETTADYMLSDKFQMSLYFDKILNHPMVGSYNTSTTSVGVSFKFSLSQ